MSPTRPRLVAPVQTLNPTTASSTPSSVAPWAPTPHWPRHSPRAAPTVVARSSTQAATAGSVRGPCSWCGWCSPLHVVKTAAVEAARHRRLQHTASVEAGR